MEIYSTILWHMRKEVELSFLAHELVEFDKLVPESWCAVGNCFSLLKEHESAIKFFQRVVTVCILLTYSCQGFAVRSYFYLCFYALWT